MRAWMQPIIYWVNEYYGNRWYLLFAVVAYIYLFFATKESRRKIVYPSVLLAFLVLNPILYQYVYSKIIYWRLMWLLPNTLAIAYATVLFVRKRKHIAVKVIAFVLVLAAVVWKGTNVYTHSGMAKASNQQKVDARVQQVCDEMLAVDETPKCIAALNLSYEIRQYCGDIELMYGRNVEGYINVIDDLSLRIANEMRSENPNYDYIFAQAMAKNYDFVVLEDYKTVPEDLLNQYGYQIYKNVAGYNLYYCADVEQRDLGGWIVTQYGPNAGFSMCYTIEDKDNNLIIIDGGYSWHEEKLRAIIRAHGNHVTAWIVTSPIDSNAHAFCEILQDKQGIQIDQIYTMHINDEQYATCLRDAKEWQNTDFVQMFRETLEKEKNVSYVKEDDQFEALGLSFKVLHAWDDETDAIGEYQEYNGSLCFQVQGKEQKMLFLSKMPQPMEPYLKARHADELKSDYVQANNNGEWTMSGDLYNLISPSYVFMDCGERTMSPEAEGYGAWGVYNYMTGILHAQIGSYDTLPNWIILK